jgi:hypothetical protein
LEPASLQSASHVTVEGERLRPLGADGATGVLDEHEMAIRQIVGAPARRLKARNSSSSGGAIPRAVGIGSARCCSATTRPEGKLVYAGRAGTGIRDAELERLWQRLHPLARRAYNLSGSHFMFVYDAGRAIGAERPQALAFDGDMARRL